MKNLRWKLGLVISLVLSLISLSFRFMQINETPWNATILIAIYNLFTFYISWLFLNLLLSIRNKGALTSKPYGLLCIIGVSIPIIFLNWIFYMTLDFPDIKDYIVYPNIIFRILLLNCLFYFIVHHFQVLDQEQKNNIEIAELKQAQLEAKLSSLKEQLSPHLLFNTLNTLSTLTMEKNVKDYVSELAQVYRYVLLYEKRDSVTLKEELKFIESYLYLVKIRLEDAIQIKIQVSEDLLNTLIPPLTLQLLIENAVKHNITSLSKPLNIHILSDSNHLIVSNNFQPKRSVQHSVGIGLDNVMQRYRLLFNRDIFIENSIVSFTIKLPIIKQ